MLRIARRLTWALEPQGSNMFLPDHDEAIASEYFNFSNDVVGVLAIGLAATALQLEHPQPFAWFFLGVISLWGFGKGAEYRKIVKHYINRHKGFFRTIALFWRVKIFMIGVALLTGIGLGFINQKAIYAWSGF